MCNLCVTCAFASEFPRVTVEIQPEKSTFVSHQPIDFTFLIHNFTAQSVTVDLGDNRKANLVLRIAFPNGTRNEFRLPQREGLARIGQVKVDAGDTYSQPLLINEWADLSTPGVYQIAIQVRGLMRSGNGSIVEQLESQSVVADVRSPDDRVLASFCLDILQRLLSSRSYIDAEHAAEVLSYTHDPIAVPYLAKAFLSPYPIEALLVAGLERISNDDSIRVLLDVARTRPEAATEIKQALGRLRKQTSNLELQEQISRILREN
jgi:hypothetical protein